jgi:hypothetical protein
LLPQLAKCVEELRIEDLWRKRALRSTSVGCGLMTSVAAVAAISDLLIEVSGQGPVPATSAFKEVE